MSNILKAFIHIVDNYQSSITQVSHGNNRANSMEEGLERFIQNSFANIINVEFTPTNELGKVKKVDPLGYYRTFAFIRKKGNRINENRTKDKRFSKKICRQFKN
jgi:hypothetical protein